MSSINFKLERLERLEKNIRDLTHLIKTIKIDLKSSKEEVPNEEAYLKITNELGKILSDIILMANSKDISIANILARLDAELDIFFSITEHNRRNSDVVNSDTLVKLILDLRQPICDTT